MPLARVMMRLARNPEAGFAQGDDEHGYSLVAPLGADGLLDEALWREAKDRCVVRAFASGEQVREGRLARRGANWFFDYDRTRTNDDEPVFKLDRHKFVVGEYVTVTDEDDGALVYRITQVDPQR